MEYRVLTPKDAEYPARLRERLGSDAPTLYAHGSLANLSKWTMSVVGGEGAGAMMELWAIHWALFPYEIHMISGWHSPLEAETFRVMLEQAGIRLTLISARGLATVTEQSLLHERFGMRCEEPGFLPECELREYYRRFREGELLVLSATDPDQRRLTYRDIMQRSRIACLLADAVFIPYAVKVEKRMTIRGQYKGRPTKTFRLVRQLRSTGIPMFTLESRFHRELGELGVPAFTKATVGPFLESLGARKYTGPSFAELEAARAAQEVPREAPPLPVPTPKNPRQTAQPTGALEQLKLFPRQPAQGRPYAPARRRAGSQSR